MKNTLLAAAVAGLAGTAAFAGSPAPYPAPYVEHVYMDPPKVEADWDGFYGGLTGGMQSGTVTGCFFCPLDVDATTYGGFAGYNFQQNEIVVGAEIAAQMGNVTFTPGPTGNVDMLVDAKIRFGYSLGDALVFASGGYTTVGTDLAFAAKGWNAGAGLDYAINDKFFVGGEYVYRNMPTTVPAGSAVSTHGGQLRAGVKF